MNLYLQNNIRRGVSTKRCFLVTFERKSKHVFGADHPHPISEHPCYVSNTMLHMLYKTQDYLTDVNPQMILLEPLNKPVNLSNPKYHKSILSDQQILQMCIDIFIEICIKVC